MAQVGLLGLGQVVRQGARRPETQQLPAALRRQGLLLQPQAAGNQRLPGPVRPERAVLAGLAQAVQPVPEERRHLLLALGAGGENGLAGQPGGQLVEQLGLGPLPLEGTGGELPGGQVAPGQGIVLPVVVHRADEVVAALVQHHVVHGGARGDDAHDVPLHQPLGGSRVLHLLADGHLIPPLDQPGNIALGGVVGHAAHGHPILLRLVPVPGGEGQAQLLGADLGVLVEHLVKVTQPEKEQAVRILLLHLQVLAHHGGQFCHREILPSSLLGKTAARISPSRRNR